MPERPSHRHFRLLALALVALLAVGGAVGWYIVSGTRDARARAAFEEYSALRSAADGERQLADNCAREATRVKTLAEREPKRLDLPADEAERRANVLTAEEAAHIRHAEELTAQAAELRRRWGSVWARLGYHLTDTDE